jgi:hypothetical protein
LDGAQTVDTNWSEFGALQGYLRQPDNVQVFVVLLDNYRELATFSLFSFNSSSDAPRPQLSQRDTCVCVRANVQRPRKALSSMSSSSEFVQALSLFFVPLPLPDESLSF